MLECFTFDGNQKRHEETTLFSTVTLLAAQCHMTWPHDLFKLMSFTLNMSDDTNEHGRYRRGRYKKYLHHYNLYKFEAARTKSWSLNRRKADSCSYVSQSCNNEDPEIDSCEELSFNCLSVSQSCNNTDPEIDSCEESSFNFEESTLQLDVHSSEATLSSDEQLPGISKTRDLWLDGKFMFGVEASDEELSTPGTSYTRFLREEDDATEVVWDEKPW